MAVQTRQVVLRSADGLIKCVPFPPAWGGSQLRKAIDDRGLFGAELIEVYLLDEESPEVALEARRALTDVFGQFSARCWYGGEVDGQTQMVELTSGITVRYLRGIAKIAFHFFMWSNASFRGDEPELAAVRAFIRHGDGDWRNFVSPVEPPFIPQFREGYVPRQMTHFLSAETDRRDATVGLHLFVGPNDVPPASSVRLGASPSRLHAHWHRCFQIQQRAEVGDDGFAADLEEVDVAQRRILTLSPWR